MVMYIESTDESHELYSEANAQGCVPFYESDDDKALRYEVPLRELSSVTNYPRLDDAFELYATGQQSKFGDAPEEGPSFFETKDYFLWKRWYDKRG